MPPSGFPTPNFKLTKYSNAYMLVYIRESDWSKVSLKCASTLDCGHVVAVVDTSNLEEEACCHVEGELITTFPTSF